MPFLFTSRSWVRNLKARWKKKPEWKKRHYKNLSESRKYYSSWFKKLDIFHWNQNIWGGFIFFFFCHSSHIIYSFPGENWNLKYLLVYLILNKMNQESPKHWKFILCIWINTSYMSNGKWKNYKPLYLL